jgi:hypothetical protein
MNMSSSSPPQSVARKVLVSLYWAATFAVCGLTMFALAGVAAGSWHGYCSHGGGIEIAALVGFFGWPIVVTQLVLSLLVGRTVPRRTKLLASLAPPGLILLAVLPCI